VALSDWVRPVAYCEIDPYCQGILLSRMSNGSITSAPIWDDIRTLYGTELPRGFIDIIFGGFPCQDISVAGNGKGLEGERSGLFFEIVRLAKEIKPKFIFIENVAAIVSRGASRIVYEITKMGYDCRWCCLSASEVGAVHKRERFFLLAHSNGQSSRQTDSTSKSIENEEETRLRSARQDRRKNSRICREESQCPLLGMDDGLPYELDRAKAVGNAVDIRQAKEAFKILMGLS
jgi:DNA (cytosine-5)-methyltransferase 1